MKKLLAIYFLLTSIGISQVLAQTDSTQIIDYSTPANYEIGDIVVEGNVHSDGNAIIAISGLSVGKQIQLPGQDISKAIKALWRLRLFTDVQIYANKRTGDVLFLTIEVQERPRLSGHAFRGVKKSKHDDLNGAIARYLLKGGIVTESVKMNAKTSIKDYFIEKGFLDAEVKVIEIEDSVLTNSVRLVFDIDKKKKVKIDEIAFTGNTALKDKKLRKLMGETKRRQKWFSGSKFIKNLYEEDKLAIINHYNTIGYRDARIVRDSIYRVGEEKEYLKIEMDIEEGQQYYFRDIAWKGNSIYKDEILAEILGIQRGDIYNQELLEARLRYSPDGRDVSTLYMDNGYLFFQVNPAEVGIDGDSIDLEVRIFEGPQATIDKVIVKGNDRTHEHVVRRELRTKPGQKFSRSDIIRSQREIVNLGYFNPEALGINTPVDAQRGTVDIEYTVEEKPSDQLELSAGWGGTGRGVIGTLGVTFNNFSLRNILKPSTWSPLPQGDGQRLSLRAQTNGRVYQSYNFSFTEPWLGGKKPNSFTVGAFHSSYTNGRDKSDATYQALKITGASVGLGMRLKVPDDYFTSSTTLSFQNIKLNNWSGFSLDNGQPLNVGSFNNFNIQQTIARNSVSDPIFPKSGARISLSLQLTLPYSAFNNKDYTTLEPADKFEYLEYHKWRLDAEWYTTVVQKLVFKASVKIGLLGYYNKDIGVSPFERFELGGDGISNFNGIQGKEIISLRGYDVGDLSANGIGGASVFDKFTLELRYPISLNPMSTIYVLSFIEGGNSWNSFKDFNPLELRRSAGVGLRVFLPMFGTLGFDYGFGFDKNLPANSSWTDYARFNIILGFEPQ